MKNSRLETWRGRAPRKSVWEELISILPAHRIEHEYPQPQTVHLRGRFRDQVVAKGSPRVDEDLVLAQLWQVQTVLFVTTEAGSAQRALPEKVHYWYTGTRYLLSDSANKVYRYRI